MGDGTKIEWAESSLNPVRARNRENGKIGWFCIHESDGCKYCYSEAFNRRLGTRVDYRAQDADKVELFLDQEVLAQPLRWERPRRIFWGSMTDLFAPFILDEWIDQCFGVCALTPQHTHLFLTKRTGRMLYWATQLRKRGWLLRNVWMGASVENQNAAEKRIPDLLRTPAAVRWISAEPLLGPVDLRNLETPRRYGSGLLDAFTPAHQAGARRSIGSSSAAKVGRAHGRSTQNGCAPSSRNARRPALRAL